MAFYECIGKVKPFITTETIFDDVITFNDNYGNIPLVKCNSLITGYQEGSGTPSPSNVRPLHAFDSADLGKCDNNTASLWSIDNSFNGDVEFNQLVNKDDYETSKTENGVTFSVTDNVITVTGAASDDTYYDINNYLDNVMLSDHYYLILFNPLLTGSNGTFEIGFYRWNHSGTTHIYNEKIISRSLSQSCKFRIIIRSGYTITDSLVFKPQIIDLTQMFGSTIADFIYNLEQTTAGAGVAFFKALYPNDYYPYNAGTKQLIGDTLATFTFGQSIYQGSIDWKRGVVVGTWGYIASYNGETLTGEWLSDKAPYEPGTTPPTGSQVAYELATPIEIPLGGIQLLTQEGQNNIYADCGNSIVEYINIT